MTRFIKKSISVLTIILMLVFQAANVQALEAPAPPPLELQVTPPPTPEAPTPPPAPTETKSDQTSKTDDNEEALNQDSETAAAPGTPDQPVQDNQTTSTDTNPSGPNANNKTGDTTINTGDGLTTGTLTTEANSNTALQEPASPDTNGDNINNTGNGAGSDNSASSNTESSSTVIQDNNAEIGNDLNLNTNTGESSASQNVGNSAITTGDANTSGTIVNTVNTNTTGLAVSEFNVVDDTTGDLILDFAAGCILGCGIFDPVSISNTDNGSNSTNNAGVEQIVNNETFQNNEATVENNTTLTANSGYNQANQNTGGDSTITTGDANVSANVINFLNNNIAGNVILGVVNIFGDLIGDIILPQDTLTAPLASVGNTGNGADSTNSALIDNTVSNTTFQTNDAFIQNNLNFEANTGGNETSKNTGGNSLIETGEATIESQTLNIANSNINGGDWWLVLVNEAGSWIGNILGSPAGSNTAGSEGTQFTVNPNGDITVTNQGNGADSQNTAEVNQTTNTSTVQNNIASIINNLNLFANTGNNSASKNTGGDSTIKTGDANVVANLVNFVNNNIVGDGRLTITIVNVFGSWIGDFVTPSQQKNSIDDPTAEQDSSNSLSTQSANQSPNQPANQSFSNNPSVAQSQPSPVLTNPVTPESLSSSINYTAGVDLQTMVAGIQTENKDDTPAPVITPGVQNSRKVIELNLAWLLLLLPFGGVLAIVKRRLN